jgi:hypothetical protein
LSLPVFISKCEFLLGQTSLSCTPGSEGGVLCEIFMQVCIAGSACVGCKQIACFYHFWLHSAMSEMVCHLCACTESMCWRILSGCGLMTAERCLSSCTYTDPSEAFIHLMVWRACTWSLKYMGVLFIAGMSQHVFLMHIIMLIVPGRSQPRMVCL